LQNQNSLAKVCSLKGISVGDAASTLQRKIAVFYGLKYIVEDSVVPQSGMFGLLCMDTLTDRVPLRRNLHSGMPFGYTPINVCFIWAIKNMAAKTVIDSHKNREVGFVPNKYYAQHITVDKAVIFSLQSRNSVPYRNHLK
jgi:hypothetical protein